MKIHNLSKESIIYKTEQQSIESQSKNNELSEELDKISKNNLYKKYNDNKQVTGNKVKILSMNYHLNFKKKI